MRYENHVFVSYAHIDNQPLVEKEDGWISSLHRALEIRVGQLFGAAPRIWRDPKLSGNDVFADSLIDNLQGVAVLVSVISPRYVNSEWCVRELREFCRVAEAGGGLRIGNKSRVFKVVKTPVPLAEQPEELHPLLGYEFFKQDAASGRCQEFDKVFGQQAQVDFWARLDDLAHDVAELLAALDQDAVDGAAAASPSNGATVYLADTSSDLRAQWESVRRDLRQQGIRVLPESRLPLVAAELENAVRDELEQSEMSIHLLGKSYGLVPEGTTASVVEMQYEIASHLDESHHLKRLIWLPRDLEIEDDRELDFVARVRSDPAMAKDADLLETPLEDLKTVIQEMLHQEEEADEDAPGAAPAASDAPAIVYLICDREDEEAVDEVQDFLYEQGFEVLLPVFEGDAAEIRQDHEENLRTCDAVLLYYGNGSELWLRRKLRELHKIAGYGRTQPIAARAICLAPPDTPKKQRLRTHEAMVLPLAEGEPKTRLEPFLSELGKAAGAES